MQARAQRMAWLGVVERDQEAVPVLLDLMTTVGDDLALHRGRCARRSARSSASSPSDAASGVESTMSVNRMVVRMRSVNERAVAE